MSDDGKRVQDERREYWNWVNGPRQAAQTPSKPWTDYSFPPVSIGASDPSNDMPLADASFPIHELNDLTLEGKYSILWKRPYANASIEFSGNRFRERESLELRTYFDRT